ncbi:MAG: hypothetical protein E7012_06760 [Alphaproteobacteria bacterium]|nr:hypothetical protein [Alphaproteobacteria bacterium]
MNFQSPLIRVTFLLKCKKRKFGKMNEDLKQDNMLVLKVLIGHGATRYCYLHPDKDDKCVKILKKSNNIQIMKRELQTYLNVKSTLNDLLPEYENTLVKTDKGMGVVCELLKDDDGQLSKPIFYYIKDGKVDEDIISELYYFVYQLMEHDLYFYDFNLKNFVIQIKNGHKKLKYIDLKSYDNNKSWTFLKLEKIFDPLAKIIMQRRLQRLFKMLGIENK